MFEKAEIEESLSKIGDMKSTDEAANFTISGCSCWDLSITFWLSAQEGVHIRNVESGDLGALKEFGQTLGLKSKEQFCPYPWADSNALDKALRRAIQKSLEKIDVTFLMLLNSKPIGHFFLWKAGGNPHSGAYGVQVPELGVAIADYYHGRGLGGLAVGVLQVIARGLGADAIELTTALSNEAGWYTYLRAGFECVGMIRNPLEVDVTEAITGFVSAPKYRQERQMVYCLNSDRKEAVLQYLAIKRLQSEKAS